MADSEEFGPSLRRERERRGISLEGLAAATKVSVDLWEGLERNDFSRWPAGIFARAFIRDYARAIGLEPDPLVDEFCRQFRVGDRRVARIVHAQGELIGHRAEPSPERLPTGVERRNRPREVPPPAAESVYATRVVAAALDALCVTGFALCATTVSGAGFRISLGVAALAYYTASTIGAGTTPGIRFLQVLRHRAPSLFTSRGAVNA